MAEGVSLLRSLQPSDVRCEAGDLRGDATVYCSLERGPIDGRLNPNSVAAFCTGDPTACPTWRAEKDREAAGDPTPVGTLSPGDRLTKFMARARVQRAKVLLQEDSEEGRRFRGKLREHLERVERQRLARERLEAELEAAG